MSYYRRNRSDDDSTSSIIKTVIGFVGFFIFLAIIAGACTDDNDGDSVMSFSADYSYSSSETTSTSTSVSYESNTEISIGTVPWDYRIVEGTVGDLIGSDMTILPDNELIPNDDNYGTGDKVWTLQAMEADMNTSSQDRADVTLTAWESLKTFKTKQAAEEDLTKLKIQLKTEVDLVGVYKTEHQGKTRQFAVITLPSGQHVKQPIDAARYKSLKSQKKVNIILEEVHDYSNYDLTYAKFRGWAK